MSIEIKQILISTFFTLILFEVLKAKNKKSNSIFFGISCIPLCSSLLGKKKYYLFVIKSLNCFFEFQKLSFFF